MANIEAVKAYLSDPSTLARFVANPKAVAIEMGVDLTDASQVHQLERLANTCQNVLKGVASGVGVDSKIPAWGIGGECCNNQVLVMN
jgi:hypothetical protein